MVSRESVDLNSIVPRSRRRSTFDWANRHRGAVSGETVVHFGDLAPALDQFLRGSEEVVACVAWITSDRFLRALGGKRVAIIVNKEKELRTEAGARTRAKFAALRGGFHTSEFPSPLSEIADTELEAVRCVGHCPHVRSRNSPLMHSKFAVRLQGGVPVAVWTGSFNWSVNASSSIENAVEIHDPAIAEAYFLEFARVASLSEPLDFRAGKADPSWGTATAARPAPVAAKKPAAKRTPAKKPTTRKRAAPTSKTRTSKPKPTARKTAAPATKRAAAKR